MADSGRARRDAAHILSGPQFHPRGGRSFDPFGGVLRFIGRITSDVGGPVVRAVEVPFRYLARSIGRGGALTVGMAAFAAIVAYVIVLLVRRRSRLGAERAAAAGSPGGADAEQLERLALVAEEAGEFDRAVRLRFEAGLVRLERRGLVAARATRTSADLATELGSPSFERLAADLEEVVYAEHSARPDQVATSRELWPRVPEEAGHHR